MSHTTCQQRIQSHYVDRMKDIRKLWRAYSDGKDDVKDLGNIHDYGLCFDYVPADTFNGQREGFFRWQLSTGGPGDEFRFYADASRHCYRVDYVFLDWFDIATKRVSTQGRELLIEIWDWFKEMGSVQAELDQANGVHHAR